MLPLRADLPKKFLPNDDAAFVPAPLRLFMSDVPPVSRDIDMEGVPRCVSFGSRLTSGLCPVGWRSAERLRELEFLISSLKVRSLSARSGAVRSPSSTCCRSWSFTDRVDDSPGLMSSESFRIELVLRRRLKPLGLGRLLAEL